MPQPLLTAEQQSTALEYVASYHGDFPFMQKLHRLHQLGHPLTPAELLAALRCQVFDRLARTATARPRRQGTLRSKGLDGTAYGCGRKETSFVFINRKEVIDEHRPRGDGRSQ